MEENQYDSLSDVDLYNAEMPGTSTSQSTEVPKVSADCHGNTSTSETDTTSIGDVVCIVCQEVAKKSCLTCQCSYCAKCIMPHNTVPALSGHKLVEATGKVEENICQQHYRELELFCRTDQIAICVVCLGKEHSQHDIISNNKDQDARERSFIRQLTANCQNLKKNNPACYLLKTEKCDISHDFPVSRCTFGKRDTNKPTKTILMVGETGTGKTTLINTMVNYMLGVKWEDQIWFQITEEDKKKSQTKSQTPGITVYELFLETCLRIIDTPGYGATEGTKFDQKIEEYLHALFRSENGIREIEVVGLVVKASQNRLTQFQSYIFDAILSLFGKDIEKKIVVFITHSDGLPAPNIIAALNEAKVPFAKYSSGKPYHFMFNNRQHESYESDQKDLYQALWDIGTKSMDKFFNVLEAFDKTEVNMTVGVLRERKRLEACVNNLQSLIKMEELKQNELQQIQRALQVNEKEFEVDEPYKAVVPIVSSRWQFNQKATRCTICEENCHYPGCWWVKDLSWCSSMKKDRCTVCTNKCPVSAHVKDKFIFVPQTKNVIKKTADLKKHYKKQEYIEKELSDTRAKQLKLLDDVYQCIMELTKIALKMDAFPTLIDLKVLIEKMKDMGGDDEKVKMLEELNQKTSNQKRWNFTSVPNPMNMLTGLIRGKSSEEHQNLLEMEEMA